MPLNSENDIKLKKTDPIRPTDPQARQLANELIRQAKSGALATSQADGHPFSSLTSLALDGDGTPLILISRLSAHTTNLLRDPRASLLIASSGKGDPLAHARITLVVMAQILAPDNSPDNLDKGVLAQGKTAYAASRSCFLASQPKAALYIDFADFLLVRLHILRASLNGGFGKAYELVPQDFAETKDTVKALDTSGA